MSIWYRYYLINIVQESGPSSRPGPITRLFLLSPLPCPLHRYLYSRRRSFPDPLSLHVIGRGFPLLHSTTESLDGPLFPSPVLLWMVHMDGPRSPTTKWDCPTSYPGPDFRKTGFPLMFRYETFNSRKIGK